MINRALLDCGATAVGEGPPSYISYQSPFNIQSNWQHRLFRLLSNADVARGKKKDFRPPSTMSDASLFKTIRILMTILLAYYGTRAASDDKRLPNVKSGYMYENELGGDIEGVTIERCRGECEDRSTCRAVVYRLSGRCRLRTKEWPAGL